ncbi:hypothetical protein ACJMK2_039820 [Sinanodonta woodiana]|uniref:Uncharacterized protein n=1 Tax=Sinanodonta woodiana TaxID=1069815 RepID=A0ABD3WF53_SINWO
MTPRSRKKVRQKLLFQNCKVGDTEEAAQRLKGKAKIRTMGIICGKVIHRYRMGRHISRSLGVRRKQLLKARVGKSIKKQRLNVERQSMRTRVRLFMESDDNSTCLPGKKDAKREDEHQHKRTLNDYIYDLHRKFFFSGKQQHKDKLDNI